MSNFKYPLLNSKKGGKEYNLSKNNLKSLDYELDNDENINKFKKFNSYSIKNIFSSKTILSDNVDLPVKLKLNSQRNFTSENNLIMNNNLFNKQLQRKTSSKNIKNKNKLKIFFT